MFTITKVKTAAYACEIVPHDAKDPRAGLPDCCLEHGMATVIPVGGRTVHRHHASSCPDSSGFRELTDGWPKIRI